MKTYEQERDSAAKVNGDQPIKINDQVVYFDVTRTFIAGADWSKSYFEKVIAEKAITELREWKMTNE